MIEEVIYADLRFHDSSQQDTTLKLEKDVAVDSPDHNVKRPGCQKVALILTGFLVFILLGALLVMTILLLQAHGKQAEFYDRIENVSQALTNIRSNLCMRNKEMQDEPCLLCPVNWYQSMGKCYYTPQHMSSWQESQAYCSTLNSTLILPKTEAAKVDILNYFKQSFPLWIGLSCPNEQWIWEDNTTEVRMSKGSCKETKCAIFFSDLSIYSERCNRQVRFICERIPVDLSINI